MFPYKTEAIADKRTTNPLQSEEKKARTYFKSDWTCFKASNSVSPIGHRSSQTCVPLKIVLVRSVVVARKIELNSTDRVPLVASDTRRSASLHQKKLNRKFYLYQIINPVGQVICLSYTTA